MATTTPRRTSTPIRVLSGSTLNSHVGRSSQRPTVTPLSFLEEEALPILAEETAALHANLADMADIQQSLSTFNESFAAFLYGIKMNAFCVEWPEVRRKPFSRRHPPTRISRHGQRAQRTARRVRARLATRHDRMMLLQTIPMSQSLMRTSPVLERPPTQAHVPVAHLAVSPRARPRSQHHGPRPARASLRRAVKHRVPKRAAAVPHRPAHGCRLQY